MPMYEMCIILSIFTYAWASQYIKILFYNIYIYITRILSFFVFLVRRAFLT